MLNVKKRKRKKKKWATFIEKEPLTQIQQKNRQRKLQTTYINRMMVKKKNVCVQYD